MCLRVDSSVKAKKVNKNGYCIGWKIMTSSKSAWYASGQYKLGLNTSDRTDKRHACISGFLSDDLVYWQQMPYPNLFIKGYHLFLKRDDARFLIKNISERHEILCNRKLENHEKPILVQVLYKTTDVIAYGKCSLHSNNPVLNTLNTLNMDENKKHISNMDNVVVMRMYVPNFEHHR